MKSWGLPNVSIVPPAVDAPHLHAERLDLGREITLLMASAPWTEEQFDTKGVDALLQAAAFDRSVKLILLWRGQFLEISASQHCRTWHRGPGRGRF